MRLHRGSVLPRISVERKPEGTLLRAAQPTRADVRELILYFIAFLMFAGAALATRGNLTALAMRGLNAAGVFMGFLAVLARHLRRRRLFRGTLLFSRWPLRLGDTVAVRFRAMLKKSAPVTEVAAKLQCVEQAVVGNGREVRKPVGVLFELDLPCAKSERHIVDEEWTVTIPAELPPSFDVAMSKVDWRITAMLGEVPAEFRLLVTPQ